MKATCTLCPHRCAIADGQTGLCRARINRGGRIKCGNYGKITALALDPIEKKPLRRFYPGSHILSVGSYGCNLRCPFCQNHEIAMAGGRMNTTFLSPEDLVQEAVSLVPRGNIGLAYTYNEPLIGYEYVRDCSALARQRGLKNVLVTNGYLNPEPFNALLPLIDAINIDLKGFTEEYYAWVGGDLTTVQRSIALAAAHCHVEVTTLVLPGKNDDPTQMRALAAWLASVDPGIPLHITRFFPRYRVQDLPPTPIETVVTLAETARGFLQHVYAVNC
ncbi:MAG: AmmeMemoRadiSam system radical SAM enzyme [Intestinibacillus sp.]